MKNLLIKLSRRFPITDADIEEALAATCEDLHSGDCSSCPVWEVNGGKTVNGHKPFRENRGCDCFKDGKKMREFLRNNV